MGQKTVVREAADLIDASALSNEAKGYLDVPAHIIGETVVGVKGRNIALPNLEPDRTYRIKRSIKALTQPDTLRSLAAAPVVIGHGEVNADNYKERLAGTVTGQPGLVSDTTLGAPLRIFAKEAKRGYETGKRMQISTEYGFDTVLTPGQKDYDGEMANIQFDHIALVEKGQNGPSMRLSESEEDDMGLTDDDKSWFETTFEGLFTKIFKTRSSEEEEQEETPPKRKPKKTISMEEHEAILARREKLAADKEMVKPHLKLESAKTVISESDDSREILGCGLVALGEDEADLKDYSADELRGMLRMKITRVREEADEEAKTWSGIVNGGTADQEANKAFDEYEARMRGETQQQQVN